MPWAAPFDLPTLALSALAVVFALISCWEDPGLRWIGAKSGLTLLWFSFRE